ncbi:DeoR family transcriptional regulator, partial [Rhizobium ruizarguesonis]
MLAEQRRQQIMLELQRVGQARTRQLAEFFEVSEVTIRSDLEIMDAKKQLIKTHGGAIALPSDSPAAAFEERMQRNFDAKRRIAQMAARQIIDNQSIVFDSGSTLLQVVATVAIKIFT